MITPEKFWQPTTPELVEQLQRNRAAFKDQFGSFDAVAFDSFWLGTSPNGKFLAFQFHRPDGSIHRFALPDLMAQQFFNEIAAALEEMGQRQLASVKAGGQA